jgi:hypothetical protein
MQWLRSSPELRHHGLLIEMRDSTRSKQLLVRNNGAMTLVFDAHESTALAQLLRLLTFPFTFGS